MNVQKVQKQTANDTKITNTKEFETPREELEREPEYLELQAICKELRLSL